MKLEIQSPFLMLERLLPFDFCNSTSTVIASFDLPLSVSILLIFSFCMTRSSNLQKEEESNVCMLMLSMVDGKLLEGKGAQYRLL
jgi:hypothetical protein